VIPEPLLQILKYCLLALLWLFFLRVLRAVWAEVKKSRSDQADAAPARRRTTVPPAAGEPVAHRAAPPASPWSRPQEGQPVLRLSVVEPPEHRGKTFELDEEITVGRGQGCGVALTYDSFTSNRHARLWREDGQVWVEDLGSTNGTYLNKRRLTGPATLARGDRLQVGQTVLEVGR
jgi:hypothetical protein